MIQSIPVMKIFRAILYRKIRMKTVKITFASFVNMRDVVAANPEFVKALAARKINKKGDRLVSKP